MADKIDTLQFNALNQTYKCTLGVDNDEVIIGDAKSVDFKPHIEFSKWNGEEKLSIEYLGLPASTPTVENGIVKIDGGKEGFYFDRNSDELFKFGLILNDIPDKSKVVSIDGVEYYQWQFKLVGWENFDFFYQPPLKNVNPDGSTWIQVGNGKITRPIEVNGSWAVYHKSKKDYIVGVTPNYQTGKFCHIYNILFTDALGKTIRISPDIKNGDYIVNIPQDFFQCISPTPQGAGGRQEDISELKSFGTGNIKQFNRRHLWKSVASIQSVWNAYTRIFTK